MIRFEKPFKTHISFELIPINPLEQFEEISDVILFGYFFNLFYQKGAIFFTQLLTLIISFLQHQHNQFHGNAPVTKT